MNIQAFNFVFIHMGFMYCTADGRLVKYEQVFQRVYNYMWSWKRAALVLGHSSVHKIPTWGYPGRERPMCMLLLSVALLLLWVYSTEVGFARVDCHVEHSIIIIWRQGQI